MNPELSEDLLRAVMGEDIGDDFPDHLGILRSLAKYKYDHFEQYSPGRQFIESLALWLFQFTGPSERKHALQFVLKRLIFVSDLEMRHLVSLMALDRIPRLLQGQVTRQISLPRYAVAAARNTNEFRRAARASLFLGMSDGARIDQLRRSNEGLSNEQFAMNYELSDLRACAMTAELRKDTGEDNAEFKQVFLVDDFSGSGHTILRRREGANPEGRLVRFVTDTLPKISNGSCPKVFIALYMATDQAIGHLQSQISSYPSPPWSGCDQPEVVAVMTIGDQFRFRHGIYRGDNEPDASFDRLLHRYYDPSVEDEHMGRVLHGFADCGLPLVLSHNSPNNSLYLLWERKETQPLFPRFERHQSRTRGD